MNISSVSINRPVLASGDLDPDRALRRHRVRVPRRARIPERRSADHHGHHQLRGRKRGHHREPHHRGAGGEHQWHRGYPHAHQREQRWSQHHHRGVRAGRGPGGRRQRRARPREPQFAQPAAGCGPAHRGEERCGQQPHRVDDHPERSAQLAGAFAHRERCVQGAPADASPV